MNKTNIALLSIAATLVLSACGTGEASVELAAAESEAPLPVEVVLPRVTDVFETFETTTTITTDAEAPAIARVAGEVVELLLEEGDRVEKGQVMARLDGERLRLRMEETRAVLDMTVRELARAERLHERGLLSAAAFEGLEYDVEALTAAYEIMRLNYGYTRITAPISGVIASRDIKPGAHVEAGASAFRIVGTAKLVAYLHIPQVELARIEPGDEASVTVDAMPGHEFRATIDRISPTIDTANGTFRATLYIDNAEGLLAPGMFSRFRIACEEHEDALVVPSRAIIQEDGGHVVYVVENGSASRRAVVTGIRENGLTEILSGLGESDKVIVTGQTSLRDGSKVLASNSGNSGITG